MAKKRIFIPVIIIIVLAICLLYIAHGFHKAYKVVKVTKEKFGYKTPSKSLPTPVFERDEWKGILIDDDITYTDGAHNIVPYDLDNDDKVELIANSYRSDALILYKYEGDPHDPINWTRYVIDSSVGGDNPRRPSIKIIKSTLREKLLRGFTSGAHYTAIADLDNDGRDDLIVAGDCKKYDILWYKTPKNIADISAWRKHIIYRNDSHQTYHVETGDIDGDGDIDIVGAGKWDEVLFWLRNNGTSENWDVTFIDTGLILAHARIVDLNKDGKSDVVATGKSGFYFYTYSASPINSDNWQRHTISTSSTSEFEIGDIDGDDKVDIVTNIKDGSTRKLYLYKNPFPNDLDFKWERYLIDNNCDPRELDVEDVNGDGYMDIVIADQNANSVIWFANNGSTFYHNWRKNIVDKSDQYLKWCHYVELGDINKDGDLDIAVAAAGSNVFLLYFNMVNQSSKR
jgi:hypothetical protein